jgi:hypothetical protein
MGLISCTDPAPQPDRRTWLLLAVFAAFALRLSAASPPGLRLPDLDNQLVDPFQTAADTKAIVFLFISVDCPVSNRYAPEIRRLSEKFGARGVVFRLVYPNPAESPEAIRGHLKDYRYPASAMRDPRQQLAKFAKATITPEAALFDKQGRRLYLGRIDDRYVNLGLERPAPTRHDLEEALDATLAGTPVQEPIAPAVGCYIADFAQ